MESISSTRRASRNPQLPATADFLWEFAGIAVTGDLTMAAMISLRRRVAA